VPGRAPGRATGQKRDSRADQWPGRGRARLRDIAGKTSDPERALRNLLERDRMFTERVRAEASDLGLRVIEVDITMTGEELAGRVSEAFGL